MPAEGRNPGNFVGWAYQCLHSSAMSAEASAKLHDTLLLRTLSIPGNEAAASGIVEQAIQRKEVSWHQGRAAGSKTQTRARRLKLAMFDNGR